MGKPLDAMDEFTADALDLLPDELIVWSGRPYSRYRVVRPALAIGVFGLFLVGFGLFWSAGAMLGYGKWDKGRDVRPFEPSNVARGLGAAALMVPFGLVMFAVPIRAWRKANRTLYVLTNLRAIVCEPCLQGEWLVRKLLGEAVCSGSVCGDRIVRSFPRESLGEMKVIIADSGTWIELGDLIFALDKTSVQGLTLPVGFLGVKDVREVEVLVRQTFALPTTVAPSRSVPESVAGIDSRPVGSTIRSRVKEHRRQMKPILSLGLGLFLVGALLTSVSSLGLLFGFLGWGTMMVVGIHEWKFAYHCPNCGMNWFRLVVTGSAYNKTFDDVPCCPQCGIDLDAEAPPKPKPGRMDDLA